MFSCVYLLRLYNREPLFNVTYTFQSEFTHYSSQNVKELLARNRPDIWSLSDRNGIRTHNHLICKRALSHLAKWLNGLTKWFGQMIECPFTN